MDARPVHARIQEGPDPFRDRVQPTGSGDSVLAQDIGMGCRVAWE